MIKKWIKKIVLQVLAEQPVKPVPEHRHNQILTDDIIVEAQLASADPKKIGRLYTNPDNGFAVYESQG